MLDRSTLVMTVAAFFIGAAGVHVVRNKIAVVEKQEQVATLDESSGTSTEVLMVGRSMAAPERKQFEAACHKVVPADSKFAEFCSCLSASADRTMSRLDRALFIDIVNEDTKQLPSLMAALDKGNSQPLSELMDQSNRHFSQAAEACQSYGKISMGITHGPGATP